MKEKNETKLKCSGSNLRGCPHKAEAVCDTTSYETWKGKNHGIMVHLCKKCADALIKKNPAKKD